MRRWAAVFIFKLDANDRSAIFPVQPVQLPRDFAVKDFYLVEIIGVVRARSPAFLQKPVRKTAVAHFAVVPGAASHKCLQANFLARLNKAPQVPCSRPIKLSLDLLMV